MKFTEAKSLSEWEEKAKGKSFPSKEEINVFILFREKIEWKISSWSVLLIVKGG